MKNSTILEYKQALEEVMNENLVLPVSAEWKIVSNHRKLAAALDEYYETRNRIIQRYSNGKDLIEKGTPEYEKAIKALTELADQEGNEVELKMLTLPEIESCQIPIGCLKRLAIMIEE